MRIGETVIRHPITTSFIPHRYDMVDPMQGVVVYIHPTGRYHTVEFRVGNNVFRESFCQYDLVPGDTHYDQKHCYHFDD